MLYVNMHLSFGSYVYYYIFFSNFLLSLFSLCVGLFLPDIKALIDLNQIKSIYFSNGRLENRNT